MKDLHIFVIGDITPAHRLKVRGLKLAIDDRASMFLKEPGQMNQGQFAAVGNQREHALPKEGPSDVDAIQTTDQTAFVPYLGAGREPQRQSRTLREGASLLHDD